MPRLSCCDHAGVPLHLVQRSRGPMFVRARDALSYLDALGDAAARHACAVHAYVLMRNHVHLLLTAAQGPGVSRLMEALGGPPFDASPVYAPRYLLSCMRYIEENPVRAGLVLEPGAWRWSSFAANALGREDPMVTPHAVYCALGRSPERRRARYRAMFWNPANRPARGVPRARQPAVEYRVLREFAPAEFAEMPCAC